MRHAIWTVFKELQCLAHQEPGMHIWAIFKALQCLALQEPDRRLCEIRNRGSSRATLQSQQGEEFISIGEWRGKASSFCIETQRAPGGVLKAIHFFHSVGTYWSLLTALPIQSSLSLASSCPASLSYFRIITHNSTRNAATTPTSSRN